MWGQPNKPIWLASSSAILAKDERIKGHSYARRQDGEDAVDMRSQVSETNVIGNEGGLWPIWGKSRASQLAPLGLTISQVESKHFNFPRALHLSYTYSATDSARTRLIIQYATSCIFVLKRHFNSIQHRAERAEITFNMASPRQLVNVGIIGCGEIAQVVHIPTLGFLSDYFRVTYLCDASESALEHCKSRVMGGIVPKTTKSPAELCQSPDVKVVLVASSDAHHAEHAVLALEAGKHVFLEKPAALNVRDLHKIKEAEKKSGGKVMVGYMRRYAAAFEKAVELIGGMDKIIYARVRDIIGPNSTFVDQSGTFPKKFTDFSHEDSQDLTDKTADTVATGLSECGVSDTETNRLLWRLLGGLGSHDLSAMREALGMPKSVRGASAAGMLSPDKMFWNAIFEYEGFNVTYESGIDNVPRFDAHIEVYSKQKTVRIQYDTPYVKGLPIYVKVAENDGGVFKETQFRITYEDAYTQEFKLMYDWCINGKSVKTTIADAENDTKIFGMIMKAAQ
ncbi:hypothetical protein G7054_g1653 [Neopestalotiopsis clavispora]|nr:hypothetical protein G7054_g1653 [Neopestalotiopsis clavispora]